MSTLTIPQKESMAIKYENVTPPSLPTYKTTFHIVLEKDEEGRYIATCLELQGVVTDGKTEREVMRNARDAVNAMLDARGLKIKEFNLIALSQS